MLNKVNKSICKKLRHKLSDVIGCTLSADINTLWIKSHISSCERCRSRLRGFNLVEMTFGMIKNQRHGRDLMSRANRQAISVLRRPLRRCAQAYELQQVEQPETIWQRFRTLPTAVGHAAACMGIVVILKMGFFSSMDAVQQKGQLAVREYYRAQSGLEENEINDLFQV